MIATAMNATSDDSATCDQSIQDRVGKSRLPRGFGSHHSCLGHVEIGSRALIAFRKSAGRPQSRVLHQAAGCGNVIVHGCGFERPEKFIFRQANRASHGVSTETSTTRRPST